MGELYPILPDTAVVNLPACWVSPGAPWMIPAGLQALEAGMDMAILASTGPFVAFMVEEHPVWIAGIHQLWPGVGIIWQHLLEPPVIHEHVVPLLRLVRSVWIEWHASGAWRYLEGLVAADDHPSRRFIEWLGFQVLARKVGFGPQGETYLLYAWMRGERHGA